MNGQGRRWPAPVRVLAEAAEDAVAAARAREPEPYEAAVTRLVALNPEHVGLVLGAVVRMLLEELHPDGLAGEDVQAVLERCARGALPWFPGLDPAVLVVLLTGALGVHEPAEEAERPAEPAVVRHAPLLVADLLAAVGRPLSGYLEVALTEIQRTELMELP
ncbi:hypothetical protein AB0J86_36370 [Micromonospora sp. NPDC049559]|uniref:hypothetical protein n=1 Tax=Micromonospora sp. NPDC049559 TaxID=3155923 RepID=UPI0034481E6A